MKVSESEIILIVVLVLIGFVLYTSRTMKTTGVKTVGVKHLSSTQRGGTWGSPCRSDSDCSSDDSDNPLYCIHRLCKWSER